MSNTAEFSISMDGEKSHEKWTGSFTVKTQFSFRDDLKKDGFKRDLLGGVSPLTAGERALNIAEVYSELWVRIVKAPAWWTEKGNGIDLVDDNVTGFIFKEALRLEAEAYAKIKEKGEAALAELRKTNPSLGG